MFLAYDFIFMLGLLYLASLTYLVSVLLYARKKCLRLEDCANAINVKLHLASSKLSELESENKKLKIRSAQLQNHVMSEKEVYRLKVEPFHIKNAIRLTNKGIDREVILNTLNISSSTYYRIMSGEFKEKFPEAHEAA